MQYIAGIGPTIVFRSLSDSPIAFLGSHFVREMLGSWEMATMNHRLHRSRVRYAEPATAPHMRSRDRLARRRMLEAPFAPVPDLPGSSAARGITIGIPVAFALWALAAWAVTPGF